MMDFRIVPGEDKDKWRQAYLAKVRLIEAQMQAVVPETRIDLSDRFDVPGLQPEEDGAAEMLVRQYVSGESSSPATSWLTR